MEFEFQSGGEGEKESVGVWMYRGWGKQKSGAERKGGKQ